MNRSLPVCFMLIVFSSAEGPFSSLEKWWTLSPHVTSRVTPVPRFFLSFWDRTSLLVDLLNLERQSFNCIVYLLPGRVISATHRLGSASQHGHSMQSSRAAGYTVKSATSSPANAQLAFREIFPKECPGEIVHGGRCPHERGATVKCIVYVFPYATFTKCLRVAVIICATMVNTQTHTDTWQLLTGYTVSSASLTNKLIQMFILIHNYMHTVLQAYTFLFADSLMITIL